MRYSGLLSGGIHDSTKASVLKTLGEKSALRDSAPILKDKSQVFTLM